MRVRRGTTQDLPFLERMLFEVAFWGPDAERPTFDGFMSDPQLRKLLAGWGRPGDTVFVAEDQPGEMGAAWFRFWTNLDHSYGYVASNIPELGLAVALKSRSKGAGRALLKALIQEGQSRGLTGLSLSVDPSNHARALYESEGFTKVGESGTSWTYVLRFIPPPRSNSA